MDFLTNKMEKRQQQQNSTTEVESHICMPEFVVGHLIVDWVI